MSEPKYTKEQCLLNELIYRNRAAGYRQLFNGGSEQFGAYENEANRWKQLAADIEAKEWK